MDPELNLARNVNGNRKTHPCGRKGQQYSGLYWEKNCQEAVGSDPSDLLSTGEAASGILCPVLGSPVQG